MLSKEFAVPIWLSISECAKLGGVTGKTVRRAIFNKTLKYKIVKNRYFIDLASFIQLLHTNKKLLNKLNFHGLGQYIEQWKN
jgi:hypothetical protein